MGGPTDAVSEGKLSIFCSVKMGVECGWEESLGPGRSWDWLLPKDGDIIFTVSGSAQPSKAYENVTRLLHANTAGSLVWLGAWPMAGSQWPRAQGSQLVTE